MCRIAIFSTTDDKLVRSILGVKSNKAKTKVIITNKPNSSVIKVAKRYNIKYRCFDNREYKDRAAHEKAIVRFLKEENIELVIFAHYMRIVTEYFVNKFRNKIINIHPSLLPDFKGANGYRDAFNAGAEKSGCTIHYVDEGLDTGKIILQKAVPRFKDDSFESFKNRVHTTECSAIKTFILSVIA